MAQPNIDIVIDCHDLPALLDFWSAALGYRKVGLKDNYGLLLPQEPSHPPVLLQRVPEPKTAKTRVHFDQRVDDVEAKAQQLERLGARRIDIGQPADANFIPMADPEGTEFCVCPGVPLTWQAARPPPTPPERQSPNRGARGVAKGCVDAISPEGGRGVGAGGDAIWVVEYDRGSNAANAL